MGRTKGEGLNMIDDVELLESACRATRISVGCIRSEREAHDLIEWADASLRLFYAAGKHELSCDVSDGKRAALEVRYGAKEYLNHKKCSDIVTLCNNLAGQLGVACEAMCPELSGYLNTRIRVGTY